MVIGTFTRKLAQNRLPFREPTMSLDLESEALWGQAVHLEVLDKCCAVGDRFLNNLQLVDLYPGPL